MRTIEQEIGKSAVLIETIDAEVIRHGDQTRRATAPTGIAEQADAAYEKVKELLQSVSQDLGACLERMEKSTRPDHVELEFGLGFAAETGLWIMTSKGTGTFRVKLRWDLGD